MKQKELNQTINNLNRGGLSTLTYKSKFLASPKIQTVFLLNPSKTGPTNQVSPSTLSSGFQIPSLLAETENQQYDSNYSYLNQLLTQKKASTATNTQFCMKSGSMFMVAQGVSSDSSHLQISCDIGEQLNTPVLESTIDFEKDKISGGSLSEPQLNLFNINNNSKQINNKKYYRLRGEEEKNLNEETFEVTPDSSYESCGDISLSPSSTLRLTPTNRYVCSPSSEQQDNIFQLNDYEASKVINVDSFFADIKDNEMAITEDEIIKLSNSPDFDMELGDDDMMMDLKFIPFIIDDSIEIASNDPLDNNCVEDETLDVISCKKNTLEQTSNTNLDKIKIQQQLEHNYTVKLDINKNSTIKDEMVEDDIKIINQLQKRKFKLKLSIPVNKEALQIPPFENDCSTPQITNQILDMESMFSTTNIQQNISTKKRNFIATLPLGLNDLDDLTSSTTPNRNRSETNSPFSYCNPGSIQSSTTSSQYGDYVNEGSSNPKKKRGRPPKQTPYISERPEDMNDADWKYREQRDKNNEASRKSRINRKNRETKLEKEERELDEQNVRLIQESDDLAVECEKWKKAVMKLALLS